MPTKYPTGSARFNFDFLISADLFDRAKRRGFLRSKAKEALSGEGSPQQRWLHYFDNKTTDWGEFPRNALEQKVVVAPRRSIPASREELRKFCEQLVDRKCDDELIELIVQGWPGQTTLEEHVNELWALHMTQPRIYEDIVRGRHGRAIRQLFGPNCVTILPSPPDFKSLIARQGLLWCALDVQQIACRGRASFRDPLGSIVRSTMAVLKIGTFMRLTRQAYVELDRAVANYQTAAEIRRNGPNKAKIRGPMSRSIAAIAKKTLDIRDDEENISAWHVVLDPMMRWIRPRMAAHRAYTASKMAAATSAGILGSTVKHATFSSMRYAGLSPTVSLAVALARHVIAEQQIAGMVGEAFQAARDHVWPFPIHPLPALPKDPAQRETIRRRVLELLHNVRYVHLDDPDLNSRFRAAARALAGRRKFRAPRTEFEPLDQGGVKIVSKAFAFLDALGQRVDDADFVWPGRDRRHYTYWLMDVVPERRLRI